ncbi:MAG: hypothetical protein IIY05_00320 [Alistipes sp.]|nr:hypothetical protein [Alistipes sp.]
MKIFTKIALTLAVATIATSAFAGGPMTNSNQSAHFLRSIARGTSLSTDAVYTNPAGVVFMDNGFHLGINDQMAAQTRKTTSSLTMGPQLPGGFSETEFEGSVFSPVIPSVHFAWKHNRWAVMAGMGVNGGGGTIKYDNGLASFERIVSSFPAIIANQTAGTVVPTAYSRNLTLEGSSMTLAFNVGAAFRITDWLSAAAMVRVGVTNNSYKAGLNNLNFNIGGQMLPASAVLAGTPYAALAEQSLDVKQKGTSISPVVALAFHKGAWDASVKYEFKMATELENTTTKDINLGDGGMFPDGAKIKAETPALLAAAVSRHFGPVKVTAQWHHYFDKDAENSFSPVIEGNTNEYMLGVEWQISEKWLVSAGTQRTQLNMNESKYSDMNFSISSWSIAAGLKYQVCDLVGINLGIMPTIYDSVESTGVHAFMGQNLGQFKDVYKRTSMAWGIGLDLKFGK